MQNRPCGKMSTVEDRLALKGPRSARVTSLRAVQRTAAKDFMAAIRQVLTLRCGCPLGRRPRMDQASSHQTTTFVVSSTTTAELAVLTSLTDVRCEEEI